jgi:TonB family protein
MTTPPESPDVRADVFTTDELAAATGSTPAEISAWVEAGLIRTLPVGRRDIWIDGQEAVRAGRAIASGAVAASLRSPRRDALSLFETPTPVWRLLRAPFAVSSSLHAGLVAAVILATAFGLGEATARSESETQRPEKMRLVYLALPGPGGGGGGGGLSRPTPPARARQQGARALSSPVPVRKPPEVTPESPPQVEPEPVQVEAPVATVAADPETVTGVPEPTAPPAPSEGPGAEGGVGTGSGEGVGQGSGDGLGEGSGGGTGGGPYRAGSGIEPPALLREVKPDYTEQARRQGVEGDVVMEIVVRHDGTVGQVRVLQGLGHGLDERAVAAVRQWRFTPASRRGTPVDVLVEVAMEFKLR